MIRTLLVELLKWRRSWFAAVTLGAALAAPALNLIMFHAMEQARTYDDVLQNILTFHLLLTGPLIVTLIGAQLIAIEYQLDTWKVSLTAPVPRWAVYLAKWVLSLVWVLALSLATVAAGFLVAFLVDATGPLAVWTWVKVYLLGGLGLTALLPAYHLITLLTRNFFVTSGVGIVATLTAIIAINSEYQMLYPISGNLIMVSRLAGKAISADVLGSVPVSAGIQAAAAVSGLLLSLLYVQKADYR